MYGLFPVKHSRQQSTLNAPAQNADPYREGTRFRIRAKLTDKEGGKPFLYCRYDWPFEVLTRDARPNSSLARRGSERA